MSIINRFPSGGGTYQSKTVTPSASEQTISPDTGYDALSTVTVSGDADLTAANIKNGVNIFGVTGTLASGGAQTASGTDGSSESTFSVSGLSFTPKMVTVISFYSGAWFYAPAGTVTNSYYVASASVTSGGFTCTVSFGPKDTVYWYAVG